MTNGVADGPVAVDADEEDGEEGGVAEGVVQLEPEVADDVAEGPLHVGHHVHGEERDGDEADDHVGAGQGYYVIVGEPVQLPVCDKRYHHQHVAEERQQRDTH